ncbi:MAG: hypothetical protein RI967_457 [Planctomycetota bacterium]
MAKPLPPQLQQAILWTKGNMVTVAFCAIVVAVPVGAYFASSGFVEGVRADADKKARAYGEVVSALNAKVDLPIPGGESIPLSGMPTQETVAEYADILEGVRKDAEAVYAQAVRFHTGSDATPKRRDLVPASVFPAYDATSNAVVENVRLEVADALERAYGRLLSDARVGMPPAPETVAKAIEGAEKRFVQGDLKAESRAKLSAEQLAQLDEFLGKARVEQYFEVAKGISFYCDSSAFEVPTRDSVRALDFKKDLAGHDRALFDLEWRYWIASDVMQAFTRANAATPSVLQAPVKRLVNLTVLPMELSASAPAGEAAAMGDPSGMDAGMDGAGMDGAQPAEAAPAAVAAGLPKPMIDPKVDATRDYTKRFTGRVSNPVYDVRLAQVRFVAATSSLPAVFDALAAENFMTVVDVRITPADPFVAAQQGFLYGADPVSEVVATIETVWLREWLAERMPAAVRTALGIQAAPPAIEGMESGL